MGIFKSLESMQDIDSTPIGVKFTTVEYTFDSFLQKLQNNELTNHQIRNKIIFSIHKFLDYDNLVNPSTKKTLKKIWTNKNFLYNLYQILSEETMSIDILELKTFNKIVFDYCFDSENSEQQTRDLMIQIADIMNFNLKLVFTTIMPPVIASHMAILARSSFEQKACINRVNEYISTFDFSVDNIIYIYSKLYLEDFSSLFLYTMICTTNKNQVIDHAMITILDSMTSVEITKVLRRYGSYLKINNIVDVRFNLKPIFNDKSRIGRILSDLEYTEDVIIP